MESVFVVCTRRHRRHGLDSRARSSARCSSRARRRSSAASLPPASSRLSGEQVSAISNYRNLVFGLVMVIMMAWRPQGILPSKRRAAELRPDTDDIVATKRTRRSTTPSTTPASSSDERGPSNEAGKGTQMAHLVDAQNVTMQFGGLKAVNDVTLHIDEGEIVALIGPNGAGKTTFFNMLTGIYTPTEGTLTFNGTSRRRQEAARHRAHGHRADVPEHPPVPEHDRARERHGRAAHAHERERRWAPCCALPKFKAEEAARRSTTPSSGCKFVGLGDEGQRAREEPALRRPAPARDRPRAGRPSPRCSCSTSRPPA